MYQQASKQSYAISERRRVRNIDWVVLVHDTNFEAALVFVCVSMRVVESILHNVSSHLADGKFQPASLAEKKIGDDNEMGAIATIFASQ